MFADFGHSYTLYHCGSTATVLLLCWSKCVKPSLASTLLWLGGDDKVRKSKRVPTTDGYLYLLVQLPKLVLLLLISKSGDSNITVVMGRHRQDGTGVNEASRGAATIHNHPYYDPSTFDNDIALVKLSAPVEMNDYISTICLASKHSTIHPNTSTWVTGWGVTSNGTLVFDFPLKFTSLLNPLVTCLYSTDRLLTKYDFSCMLLYLQHLKYIPLCLKCLRRSCWCPSGSECPYCGIQGMWVRLPWAHNKHDLCWL